MNLISQPRLLESTGRTLDQLFLTPDGIPHMSLAFAPINEIPNEILNHLFDVILANPMDLTYSDQWHQEHKKLFIISSVCSRWRKLVVRTARYWSYITFDDTTHLDELVLYPIERIKLWLDRSQGAPIHVILPRHHPTYTEQREAVTSVLQSHAHFISSIISIGVWDAPLIMEICELLICHSKLDSVKNLVLFVEKYGFRFYALWQPVMQFTGLVSLELSKLPESENFTTSQIETVLLNNSGIRVLRLQHITIPLKTSSGSQSVISLPDLRLLDVVGLDPFSSQWLMGSLYPGNFELDARLDATQLQSIDSGLLEIFFQRANVAYFWVTDSPLRMTSSLYLPRLPAIRALGLIDEGYTFELLGQIMLIDTDSEQTARYPSIRALCLVGSTGISGLRHSRIEELVDCYSLSLLNLDYCGIGLEQDVDALNREEESLRDKLIQRIGKITRIKVDHHQPRVMDVYASEFAYTSQVG